jgi:hypothetical protein
MLFFSASEALGIINLTMLHCTADVELKGNSHNVFSKSQDSFIGQNFFECFNFQENLSFVSESIYQFQLVGPLTTGFISTDILRFKVNSFLSENDWPIKEGTYQLKTYSELPYNNKVSFYIMATSVSSNDQLLLSLHAPISLANDMKVFLEKQTLLIIKKSSPHKSSENAEGSQ